MGDRRSRSFYFLAAFFAAYVLFLYGPMIAIYILSFQGPDGGLTFPMNGVSLVWFSKVFAGAGIVGVAIGFGSQNLVRDFISGIFMLMEDQYGVGDVVDAGPATGTVEGVGLRTTRLRDVNGTLWHIPNGEIRRVGNRSQGWGPGPGRRRGRLLDRPGRGHPHHRAGRPGAGRRRPVGAQAPGAARGLGCRGARPRPLQPTASCPCLRSQSGLRPASRVGE